MLAVALLTIVAVLFHLRRATPILHLAIDRPASSHPRSPPEKAPNPPRQKTGSVQIPIAPDAPPRHILPRFPPLKVCVRRPPVRAAPPSWGPASANLHRSGHSQIRWNSDVCFSPRSGHRQADPACPFCCQQRTSKRCKRNKRGYKECRLKAALISPIVVAWRIAGQRSDPENCFCSVTQSENARHRRRIERRPLP